VPDTRKTGNWWRKLLRRFWNKSSTLSNGLDCDTSGVRCGNRRLVLAPDVRASVHNDGLALLDISTGRVFLCNETGSHIWQRVLAGLDLEAISEEISREWGVSRELAYRDTSSFIRELELRRLLVRKAA